MRIGILALQGGVEAHERALRRLGHETTRIRSPGDFEGLDGLVLPGGESTVQRKLIEQNALLASLQAHHASGRPILATCAGLIVAASDELKWLDIGLRRNGWGPQVDSFEDVADNQQTRLVFIRAPRIETVGSDVEVQVCYRGEPVGVRRENVFGATFHPELAGDDAFHRQMFGSAAEPPANTTTMTLVESEGHARGLRCCHAA